MSLFLLLLAAQAGEITAPPPIKVKPAAPIVQSPAPKVNPTITYVPAKPAQPVEAAPAASDAPEERAGPLSGVSEAARSRLALERQADSERRVELRRDMSEAHAAIAKALAAEPLDMAALRTALEMRDTVMASSRAKVTAAVIDLLGDIPPEERLVVARALIESDSAPARPAQATPPESKPKPSPIGR